MNIPSFIPYKEWVSNVLRDAYESDEEQPEFGVFTCECDSCCGTGKITCHHCSGKGEFECKTCDGIGIYEDGDTCEICNGEGGSECFICDGKKVFKCAICDGTGVVIPNEYEYYNISQHDYESQKQHDLNQWMKYLETVTKSTTPRLKIQGLAE